MGRSELLKIHADVTSKSSAHDKAHRKQSLGHNLQQLVGERVLQGLQLRRPLVDGSVLLSALLPVLQLQQLVHLQAAQV